MRGRVVAATVLLVLVLHGRVAHADPPAPQTPSSFWRWFDIRTSPFIPIPKIGTDPNAGTTVGFLPVLLYTNPQGEVTQIVAPDVDHNDFVGYGAHFRIFGYPSADTEWYAIGGLKQRIERIIDLLYSTGLTRQQNWSWFMRPVYDRTATDRFFGFGNNSSLANQTNYTNGQGYIEGQIGWNLTPSLQLALNIRPRLVQIGTGVITSLPTIEQGFPQLNGLGTEHELLNRVFFTYDTRDSLNIPSRGTRVIAFAGLAAPIFFSSVFYSVAGVDAESFIPIGDRFTFAGHAATRYMPTTANAPFWALSSLGGDRSIPGEQQPLRGFGAGRFVDRNLFSASVELRTRVFDLDLFSTRLTFEVAPFIDTGRVFHNVTDNPFSNLHTAGGVGFRGVAKPFIVGYVDVGFGSEGLAIFSGIKYPF